LAVIFAVGLYLPTVADAAIPASAFAEEACENDVWLVSVRQWNHCGKPIPMDFWRWRGRRFIVSTHEEFLASDVPGRTTCFWIHGWRTSAEVAKSDGLRVYERIAGQASCPFRMVIWSWPSEQTRSLREDARHKAWLSDVGAYPLATLIDHIDHRVPVGLVGFSRGARMATGALHLLGGGQLEGYRLDHRAHPKRVAMNAVLLAGALDNFALAVGQKNSEALGQVGEMLVMVNRDDLVLKLYPYIWGWKGPEAIGNTGAAGNLGPHHHRLAQMKVDHIVGRRHEAYFDSPLLVTAIADTVLCCNAMQGESKPIAAQSGPAGLTEKRDGESHGLGHRLPFRVPQP
jgi:hypothetical protein